MGHRRRRLGGAQRGRIGPTMSVLVYLLGALLVAGVVIAILWFRDQRTGSIEDGIDEFHRELQALAPDAKPPLHNSGRPKSGGRSG